jgi:cytidylate kinase
MAIITIRGQLGSGAPEIGKIIARKLTIDYVDREILSSVASHLNWTEKGIGDKEMPPGTLSGRILEALDRSYPPGVAPGGVYVPGSEFPLGDKDYLDSLRMVIKDLAGKGSIVIRGRGSQFILKGYPETLHVLTVCPLEIRLNRVMESLSVDADTAKKEISSFDSSRREFIKRYFNSDLENPINYDLVINTESLSIANAADIVISTLSLKVTNLTPGKFVSKSSNK